MSANRGQAPGVVAGCRTLGVLAALGRVAAAAPAAPEAMDVDREDAPVGRGELGFDGGAPVGDYALGVSVGVVDRPIALHASTGATVVPVSTRETLGLGGAIALGDSALLDLRLGFAHQAGARLAALGDDAALEAWVPLDARVGARIQVTHGAHVSVFLRGELTAPLGDERNFAGEAGWTGAWSLIARVALPGGVVAAASGGIRIRGREVAIGDRVLGDETTAALGVVVPVPPLCHLWCRDQVVATAEIVGLFGDSGDKARGPRPVEGRVGLVSRPRAWLEIAARIGAGLDDEVGAPRWRGLLSVTWRQPSAPAAPHAATHATPVDDPTDDD